MVFFFSPVEENHAKGQCRIPQIARKNTLEVWGILGKVFLSYGSWQDCPKRRHVLTLAIRSVKISKAGGGGGEARKDGTHLLRTFRIGL